MSKKNNQKTRARAHAFALQKEKEAEVKKQVKQQKKQQREAAAAQQTAAGGSGARLGVKLQSKKGIKIKARPIKLRKNKVVRGIKIVDAESRQRAKELLAAEEAMQEMEMDSTGKQQKQVNFATGEGMEMD